MQLRFIRYIHILIYIPIISNCLIKCTLKYILYIIVQLNACMNVYPSVILGNKTSIDYLTVTNDVTMHIYYVKCVKCTSKYVSLWFINILTFDYMINRSEFIMYNL